MDRPGSCPACRTSHRTGAVARRERRTHRGVHARREYEFNRELLWREYPTDQRGTPFRVFWPRPGGEADIPPIAESRRGRAQKPLSVIGPASCRCCSYARSCCASLPDPGVSRSCRGEIQARSPSTWTPVRGERRCSSMPIDQTATAYAFDVGADDLQAEVRAGAPGCSSSYFNSARTGCASDSPIAARGVHHLDRPELAGGSRTARGFASVAPLTAQPISPQDRNWGRDAAGAAQITLRLPARIRHPLPPC